ncbi:MAG: hypothetical protein DI538_04015 [Azospira oryzae]|jgi:hypothetical protein|nr:hypothetical protein [Cytophaga sp.]PZR40533.1 MAG: hypothetical protein DI538_04015 [Azospira oryzae]
MSIETVTQQLFEASQQRRVCKLKLKNEPSDRTIHPYGVCQTSKNKITIVCVQVDGFSGKSKIPGYKNLSLQDCEFVEPLDMRFLVQSNFDPENPIYKDWVFHV